MAAPSETLLIKQQNRAGAPPLRPGEPASITWTVDDTRWSAETPLFQTRQQCMTRPAAVPTVQIDNSRCRVVEWRFAPGAATGWHTHGHDYVVVPMTTGRLLLEEPGGATRHAALTAGVSYARSAGVEHDVINDNDGEFVFVEIEIK